MTYAANPRKTQQSNMEAVNQFKDQSCTVARESSTEGIIAWDQSERTKPKGPLKERNQWDRA